MGEGEELAAAIEPVYAAGVEAHLGLQALGVAPHLRRGHDLSRRLAAAQTEARSLAAAIDWLPDGVALISAGGRVLCANAPFAALMRQRDGLKLRQGRIEFRAPAAAAAFDRALAAIVGAKSGRLESAGDFLSERETRAPPYVVSLRPVGLGASCGATAALFIRDPIGRPTSISGVVRGALGFTVAEARLADALQRGLSPRQYASARGVALDTVYTHLRHLREKTGARRMTDVMRRLNQLAPVAAARQATTGDDEAPG